MAISATNGVRLPDARIETIGAAPSDAATGPADAGTPTVLRWDGNPPGWWSRNGATVGVAAAGGALGAAIAMNMRHFTSAGGGPNWIFPVAVGLASTAVAAGVTHLVRRNTDEVPEPPTGPVPTLPGAVAAAPIHGGELPLDTHIARGDGSYLERVPVTRYRSDGNGGTESYTDYEWRREYFAWNVSTDGQVGRRDGYASVDEALRDLPAGDSTALRAQDGRIVAYDMQARSHWGDVDDLIVADPATQAIVSPGGSIWMRTTYGPEFQYVGRQDRPDTTGVAGRSVGEHEVRHRMNPDVRVDEIRTGIAGYTDLGAALGDMQARPGDQVIVANGGRYHVADVARREMDPTIPNDGFVTSKHADTVVAVEQFGNVWTPSGDWYVAPEQEH